MRKKPLSIQRVNAFAFALGCVLALLSITVASQIVSNNVLLEEAHQVYEECTQATNDFMVATDYLSTRADLYVLTASQTYLDDYLNEMENTQRREEALATLRNYISDNRAYVALSDAYQDSTILSSRELYAMRLVADATNLDPIPQRLQEVRIHDSDAKLSNEKKVERAKEMLLGSSYAEIADSVDKNAYACTSKLIAELQAKEAEIENTLNERLGNLYVIVFSLLGLVALIWAANYILIVRPMRNHTKSIDGKEPLQNIGARELQQVSDSYNLMYEENNRRTRHLQRVAETDGLTGLLNRGTYDRLLESCDIDSVLVLMDVDLFKDVNDTYGHEMGDKVLKRVAASIAENFRATDHACRIGGDEFAVIMTETHNVSRKTITAKIDLIAAELREEEGDMPGITLSAGAAFCREIPSHNVLYQAADEALYKSKHNGRNRLTFYEKSSAQI